MPSVQWTQFLDTLEDDIIDLRLEAEQVQEAQILIRILRGGIDATTIENLAGEMQYLIAVSADGMAGPGDDASRHIRQMLDQLRRLPA